MFIGHYSVAFVLKKTVPKTPLWSLLVGVQLVDFLFMIFVVFGIEHMRLIPGFTASNPFDLYYMPYTHSLIAGIFWAIFAFLGFYFYFKSEIDSYRWKAPFAVFLSVLSHYFLDLPVHTPDLPIFGDSGTKLGFGLWNNLWLTVGIEAALTVSSFVYYLRGSKSGEGFSGRWGMPILGLIFLLLILINPFAPVPDNIYQFAIQALVLYSLIAFFGHRLDSKRVYQVS
ncbi:hypothetical protein JWG45_07870 [Leptospira sp. 201903070]|jgi:hypothetical protein|uniref:Metal-dependent hydrolase n=1 Tax=Leptospira ainlahdjerensis TaxID=2810033 RepID=A0ABS2UDS2_9LEPT|nr:hypothetical protein [Leptospira ainlahdjerensis]MBM9577070.1 hypothetical protein [Leptospira ainlahdjerensis]